MNAPAPAAGFFGKLATHGDFVARRLPPAFVQRWDDWLQVAMQAAREQAGACWPAAYLAGPIWRFVLAQDSCDAHAWAGILMPSTDCVGRHFPLTIAARLGHGADLRACLGDGGLWYGALEALARTTAAPGFALAEFDVALAGLPAAPQASRPGRRDDADVLLLSADGLGAAGTSLPSIASHFAPLFLQGHSLWWHELQDGKAASLMICRGMPRPALMAGMLGCAVPPA